MAKRVINQRSDDEVVIRCNCGADHFLTFERAVDDDDDQWGWASVCAEYRPHGTLWGRVKMAAKLIRKGCPWTGSAGINPADMWLIIAWCERTIAYFEDDRAEPEEER